MYNSVVYDGKQGSSYSKYPKTRQFGEENFVSGQYLQYKSGSDQNRDLNLTGSKKYDEQYTTN
jgi:hypothetical protein